jgi:hypothetical protein
MKDALRRFGEILTSANHHIWIVRKWHVLITSGSFPVSAKKNDVAAVYLRGTGITAQFLDFARLKNPHDK